MHCGGRYGALPLVKGWQRVIRKWQVPSEKVSLFKDTKLGVCRRRTVQVRGLERRWEYKSDFQRRC